MLRKFLFVTTTCFIVTASFACTCIEHIKSFNLVDYENYDTIFEVKIESSYSPNIEDVGNVLSSPDKEFIISIIEVFKGGIELTEKHMVFF